MSEQNELTADGAIGPITVQRKYVYLDRARAAVASVRAEAATRQERLSMALLAAEAELEKAKRALRMLMSEHTARQRERDEARTRAEAAEAENARLREVLAYIQTFVTRTDLEVCYDWCPRCRIDVALAPPAQPAVVVQTPDKTVFVTPPEEPEPVALDPALREPLEPTVGLDWQRPCIQVDTVNARIEALGKEIDRLQALIAREGAKEETK